MNPTLKNVLFYSLIAVALVVAWRVEQVVNYKFFYQPKIELLVNSQVDARLNVLQREIAALKAQNKALKH